MTQADQAAHIADLTRQIQDAERSMAHHDEQADKARRRINALRRERDMIREALT